MRRPARAWLAALAGGVLGLAAAAQEAPQAAPEPAAPAIVVVPLRSETLSARILGSGFVEAEERVYVQPQIEGLAIDSIEVEVGDAVEAGQVLARLSTSAVELQLSQLRAARASTVAAVAQAEAQLVEAEASRDEAARVRDRTAQLREQGSATQAAADEAEASAAAAEARVSAAREGLESARAQVEVSDARIDDAQLQLSRTEVEAPVSGVVEERDATLGGIASGAGEPLFVIVRDGLLELRADVAEQDLLRIEPGDPAEISVVGLDEPLAGEVSLVEPRVDRTTRLGRVRVAIDEPLRVRSGMFADLAIIVDRREVLAAPVSAVGRDAEGAFVYVVEGGLVEREGVETGIREGGLVEVRGPGLAEGTPVVRRSGAFVRAGDRINPVLADASDGAAPGAVTE